MKEKKRNSGRKLHKLHVAIVAMVAAVLVAGGSTFLPKFSDNTDPTVTADADTSKNATGYAANIFGDTGKGAVRTENTGYNMRVRASKYSDNNYQSIPLIDTAGSRVEDWSRLKENGVDYFLIYIGGRNYSNYGLWDWGQSAIYQNITNAQKAKIKVGAVYEGDPITPKYAREEAKECLRLLKGVTLDLPLFYAPEDPDLSKIKSDKTDNVLAFYEELYKGNYKGTVGYYLTPGVAIGGGKYTNYSYGNYTYCPGGGYVNVDRVYESTYKPCLWVAAYDKYAYNTPLYDKALTIHQYAGDYSVSRNVHVSLNGLRWIGGGTNGNYNEVDLNMAFVKRPGTVTGLSKTSGQPVFSWKAVAGAKRYQVTLQPKGGQATVTTTARTVYYYNPASFPNGGTISVKAIAADKYGFEAVSYSASSASIPSRIKLTSSNITLSSSSFTFNGKDQKPTVTVKYGNTTLSLGKDYTVSYPSNKKSVGTKTITVTGNGEYTGTAMATYTIKSAGIDISGASVSLNKTTFDYTGKPAIPVATVKYQGKTLVNGTDYTINIPIQSSPGTYTLTVKGKGKYTGTRTVQFTIKGDDIKKATVTFDSVQYYTGSKIKPAVTVKDGDTTLKQGTDYTITYGENTKVGNNSGKITINGKGRYGGSSTSKTFNILARTFTVTPNYTSYEYKPNYGREPGVVVTDPVFGEVPKDQYTVKYYNNRAIGGKAQIIVTGKGAYEGVTQTVYFVIKPVVDSFVVKNNAAGSLKITDIKTSLTNPDTRYDTTENKWVYGVEVQYADNANFRNAIAANNPENVRDSAFLTKGKTIYVRVRAWIMVDGVKYGNWVTSQLTLTK